MLTNQVAGILQPFLLVWRSVMLRMMGCDTTVMASSLVSTMNWGTSPLAMPPGGVVEAQWQPRLLWQVPGQAAWRSGGARVGCEQGGDAAQVRGCMVATTQCGAWAEQLSGERAGPPFATHNTRRRAQRQRPAAGPGWPRP